MALCPNSADWGSIADWFAVLATVGVGWIGYKLTKAANRIADEANTSRKDAERREEYQLATRHVDDLIRAEGAFTRAIAMLGEEHGLDLFADMQSYRKVICEAILGVPPPPVIADPGSLAKLSGKSGVAVSEAWAWIRAVQDSAQFALKFEQDTPRHLISRSAESVHKGLIVTIENIRIAIALVRARISEVS